MSGPSPDPSGSTVVVVPGGRTRRVAGFPVGLSGSTPVAPSVVDGAEIAPPSPPARLPTIAVSEPTVADVEAWMPPPSPADTLDVTDAG